MAAEITVAAVDKQELAAAFQRLAAQRSRPAMTWLDLLMQVTEELRHADRTMLDQPVRVQVAGRQVTLQSVSYDEDAQGLVLYPWLVSLEEQHAEEEGR